MTSRHGGIEIRLHAWRRAVAALALLATLLPMTAGTAAAASPAARAAATGTSGHAPAACAAAQACRPGSMHGQHAAPGVVRAGASTTRLPLAAGPRALGGLPVSLTRAQLLPLHRAGIGLPSSTRFGAVRFPVTRASAAARSVRVRPHVAVVCSVTTTADSGSGSLRQAITTANGGFCSSGNTIHFAIPTSDPGYNPVSNTWTITLASQLPTLVAPVTIDGTSQSGSTPGHPVVVLNGSGTIANGLVVTTSASTIEGLVIDRFSNDGIDIVGTTAFSDVVQGNIVGADASGTVARGNGLVGVFIAAGAMSNTVGGTTAAARNLISGNGFGIGISDSGTNANLVQGNEIGTNISGTAALSNTNYGVIIQSGALSNTVGGTAPGARNLISGNGYGVVISDNGTNANLVQGNEIGTNISGTAALSNTGNGVVIQAGALSNTVGGTAPGAGNLISGNGAIGIDILTANGNLVQGNRIGTDLSGTTAVPNQYGVVMQVSAMSNTVGGTTAAARNLISGNTYGVVISASGANANLVQGNEIGTNISGTAALSNTANGVVIQSGALSNTVGGTAPGAGNLISGNGAIGVNIVTASGNLVQGNRIGTDLSGTTAVPNQYGVALQSGAMSNTVGGTAPRAGNTIADNTSTGIAIVGSATTGNAVLANSIHDNGALGIDLNNDGVTPNGPPGRTGPNNLQNYPVLTGTVTDGSAAITVTGVLTESADTTYRVEVFDNVACDPSGHGEGQRFLGAFTVTTDAGGTAPFTHTLAAAVPAGHFITSTATDPGGDTSEFSACVVSMAPAASTETPTPSLTTTSTGTPTGTPTGTATGTGTPTGTATGTPTGTGTGTPTGTTTRTPTGTTMATATTTRTPAPTATSMGTATSTPVPSTATSTGTPPATGTGTATATSTGTATSTAAPTGTSTALPSATSTPAATAMGTATGTPLPPTATATTAPVATNTGVPAPTNTATGTAPPTATGTAAPSATAVPLTITPTAVPSAVPTPCRVFVPLSAAFSPLVRGGGTLRVVVFTTPGARVIVSLFRNPLRPHQVAQVTGQAGPRGRFIVRLPVPFRPRLPELADVTIVARVGCGYSARTRALLVLPSLPRHGKNR